MINGFKKELMFYTRGGRLAIMIIVMLCLAISSPIMFGFTSAMMSAMKDALPDNEQYTQMTELLMNFSVADMIMYNVEYVISLGSIITLFLFKGAAGGEQKLRSVIIPQCSGLTPERYALPKFIIYPFSVFAFSIIALYAGAGVSTLMFPGTIDGGMLAIASVCTGVFLAFMTSVQFCIGICTGSANGAIVAVIVANMIIPSVLGFFRVDRFNPFALQSIAMAASQATGESGNALLAAASEMSSSSDISTLNVAISLATAIIISVLLYFVTIFVLHTKEVHNEGDEPVL